MATTKKAIDSTKAKATPSTSSRPIIVGHEPMVKDPMVKADPSPEASATEEIKEEAVAPTPTATKKVIQPLETTDKPEDTPAPTDTPEAANASSEASAKGEEASDPAKAGKTTTPNQADQAQANVPTETADAAEEVTEAAVVDAVAEQADLGKKNDSGPSPEELKKQEEIAKLIASKKYAVPIGQVAKRRNKRASVAILILLVILIGAYLAVDAGLLDLGIKLPIEIIKN